MEPFITLTGIAAPLLRANIDTDLIIPKQFLKTLVRSGLGQHLFSEARYDAAGREQRGLRRALRHFRRDPQAHAQALPPPQS